MPLMAEALLEAAMPCGGAYSSGEAGSEASAGRSRYTATWSSSLS